MTVLNEYIKYVPQTNLWHLWAGFVVLAVLFLCFLCKEWEGSSILIGVLMTGYLMVTLVISASPIPYLERQGVIDDPPAFVEMLNDWTIVEKQGDLITLRQNKRLTSDEVKEWKKHE